MLQRSDDDSLLALIAFDSDGRIHYRSEWFDRTAERRTGSGDGDIDARELLASLGLPALPLTSDPEVRSVSSPLPDGKVFRLRRLEHDVWAGELVESRDGSSAHAADDLTGIPTRQYFRAALDRLLAETDQATEELVVVSIDLDHFKKVNDTQGHAAGDDLLNKVVARIQKVIRDSDVLARIGGDEFALILKQKKNSPDAEAIAGRVIERVGRPFLVEGKQVNIGVSVGLVASQSPEDAPEDLLKQADIALYRSKGGGKGRLTWFDQRMADEIASRHKLEIELRRAIVLGQLRLQFEPQVYQLSGDVHTMHSRIVWDHPEHGLLGEQAFMGIADSVGLVPELSRWQFDRSFAESSRLGSEVEISLPVRSSFFAESDFVDCVEQLGEKHGIDLKGICLEFSEAVLLDNDQVSGELMLQLSRLGVRLSLGDFGSGLVALSYLRVLPFSEIKIDFSTVLNSADHRSQSTMAAKIAELGSSLGIRVLASVDESRIIHTVLSEGQFNHIEKIRVSAPIDAEKVSDFLQLIESRKEDRE